MLYLSFAFLTGVTIVISMMLSSRLAQSQGMLNSILANFAIGSLSAGVLCLLTLGGLPDASAVSALPLPLYLGGLIGVLTTYIFNLVIPRVPAVYVVILRFMGQMLTSALIDYFYFHMLSPGKIFGALLFLCGLILSSMAEQRKASAL